MKIIYIIFVAAALFLIVPAISLAADCGTATDASGNTYNTVVIGTQCWMAENLRVGTKLASATTRPLNNGVIEKWCYNNDSAICASDGGLYNWDEAMQYSTTPGAQGICPSGWHIPTDSEQYTLVNYLKDPGQICDANRFSWWQCATAGTKLKSGGTSGMNFPLAGFITSVPSFWSRGAYARFWSSSQGVTGISSAVHRYLGSSDTRVVRVSDIKGYGLSVRCVNDSTSTSINVSSNISSSWTITGPTTLTGSGTSQSFTFKPSGTYTITWGAVSRYTTPATQSLTLAAGGTISFSGTYPTALPSVNLTANGASGTITIPYNTSATISWSSANTTSCAASGDWSGSKPTSGSASTGNLTNSKTYTLTCSGPGASASATIVVAVPPPDFNLNSSNALYATLTFNQKGDSNSATLTITPFNGFTSNVALSVASVSPALPGGTTYQFSPSALNQSKYSSGSQFKVKIGAGISSSKVYTITVQAADGGLVRTVNILLNAQIKNPNWKEF